MHVVATAGHVDHGKSSLVHALTGAGLDRLAEEKRRGLTIDLGFAQLTTPSGAVIQFVDVPGHIRFLKNMLAGVGAVDACLFVVAATESWKPQSEEHLRILELLGVSHGVIALTKVGLVDTDHAELVRMEVEEHVKGSFLEDAEIVAVDAISRDGLELVRAALGRLVASAPVATDRGRPRLWVDRSFSRPGAGTVVTGTLLDGTLAVDDEVAVVTGIGAEVARVRSLESFNHAQRTLPPGTRAAVNLPSVHHRAIRRGDAVVAAGRWHLTKRFDATLTALGAIDHPVSRRGSYSLYVGSGEHPVRISIIGAASVLPGATGLARLTVSRTLPLLPGDRFVLRESGRGETVGGGTVLDVDPVLPVSKARPDRSVERVVAERGWITADELDRLTGVQRVPTVGDWIVDATELAAMTAEVASRVRAAGALGLDLASLDGRERLVLESMAEVVVRRGRALLPEADGDAVLAHPLLAALEAAPFAPPSPAQLGADRAVLRALAERGAIVESDGIWFAASAVEQAAALAARLLATHPDGYTVAAFRGCLGTTRKWALPLAKLLDARGVTRRRGELRVAGPRLPTVEGGDGGGGRESNPPDEWNPSQPL